MWIVRMPWRWSIGASAAPPISAAAAFTVAAVVIGPIATMRRKQALFQQLFAKCLTFLRIQRPVAVGIELFGHGLALLAHGFVPPLHFRSGVSAFIFINFAIAVGIETAHQVFRQVVLARGAQSASQSATLLWIEEVKE